MDAPRFKQGQKIEYEGVVLTVEHVRRSTAWGDWVYTFGNIEATETVLIRTGAKVAERVE